MDLEAEAWTWRRWTERERERGGEGEACWEGGGGGVGDSEREGEGRRVWDLGLGRRGVGRRELGLMGRWGRGKGGLASPRAHQLALGEETSLLTVKFSAKPIFIKKLIKIANRSDNLPTLNMTLDMLCIAYKKIVVVKLKFKFL
jgi:hypothetical protein